MDDLSCLVVGDRERLRSRSLHVLLVEGELTALNRRGTRLLTEGFVVSTRRVGGGLFEAMSRLTPDLVVVDPFMAGLDLTLLLARGRSRSLPAGVALHTRVPRQILSAVLELSDFAGAIRKSDDDEAFISELRAIADALPALASQYDSARFLAPSSSGTHRIGETRDIVPRPRLVRGA